MFRVVDLLDIDTKQGVGEVVVTRLGDVREAEVDDAGGDEGHEDVPLEKAHGDECFPRGNYTIRIEVKEVTMLLEDLCTVSTKHVQAKSEEWRPTVWSVCRLL